VKKLDILENQVNKVYLSLGSNLGNKRKNLEYAKYLLISLGIKIEKSSNFYQTKSWPNKKFPDYLNIILLIYTNMSLTDLFYKVKYVENILGRVKTLKNYPRTCDIDIIDFKGICTNKIYRNQKITVPHKRMHKRNFVLMPLYEINKRWKHPKIKKNIVNLIFDLPIKDLRSIKLV
tara:strand:- start:1062 stop:1589 length:528 start_codon:yes stop_codon:yes gene_type:complete